MAGAPAARVTSRRSASSTSVVGVRRMPRRAYSVEVVLGVDLDVRHARDDAATSASTRRVARHGAQNAEENCSRVARSPSARRRLRPARPGGPLGLLRRGGADGPVDRGLGRPAYGVRAAEAAVGPSAPGAEAQGDRDGGQHDPGTGGHADPNRPVPAMSGRARSAAGEGRQELDRRRRARSSTSRVPGCRPAGPRRSTEQTRSTSASCAPGCSSSTRRTTSARVVVRRRPKTSSPCRPRRGQRPSSGPDHRLNLVRSRGSVSRHVGISFLIRHSGFRPPTGGRP